MEFLFSILVQYEDDKDPSYCLNSSPTSVPASLSVSPNPLQLFGDPGIYSWVVSQGTTNTKGDHSYHLVQVWVSCYQGTTRITLTRILSSPFHIGTHHLLCDGVSTVPVC